MKEYTIFVQYGQGCPFFLKNFSSLQSAKEYLYNLADDYERKKYVRKNYYIDNNFFNNKYILGLPNQAYFQIQERTVTDWENIDFKTNTKDNENKLINFIEYLDK